jgi:hypothetical protein
MQLNQSAVAAILNTTATYNPEQEILVVVTGNGEIDLNLLQDLKMLPLDCYRQIERRWAEFQLNCKTQEKC